MILRDRPCFCTILFKVCILTRKVHQNCFKTLLSTYDYTRRKFLTLLCLTYDNSNVNGRNEVFLFWPPRENVALKTRTQKAIYSKPSSAHFPWYFPEPPRWFWGIVHVFVAFYSKCGCNGYVLLIKYLFFRLSEAGRTGRGVDGVPYSDG